MVFAGQISERGGKLRTATVSPNLFGNAGPCHFTAAGTGAGLPLVLRNFSYQRRQFGDLKSRRRRIVRTGIRRQRRSALVAVFRDNGNNACHPLGRQQFLQMRWVARLSARFASGGLLNHRLGRIERIDGRRHRRIGGIVAKPSKQIAHDASNSATRRSKAAMARLAHGILDTAALPYRKFSNSARRQLRQFARENGERLQ